MANFFSVRKTVFIKTEQAQIVPLKLRQLLFQSSDVEKRSERQCPAALCVINMFTFVGRCCRAKPPCLNWTMWKKRVSPLPVSRSVLGWPGGVGWINGREENGGGIWRGWEWGQSCSCSAALFVRWWDGEEERVVPGLWDNRCPWLSVKQCLRMTPPPSSVPPPSRSPYCSCTVGNRRREQLDSRIYSNQGTSSSMTRLMWRCFHSQTCTGLALFFCLIFQPQR